MISGVSFWFKSTPPRILSVGSLAIELKTAVGPATSVPDEGELPSSVPDEGELPSARGAPAFRPSGVAGTTAPEGTSFEAMSAYVYKILTIVDTLPEKITIEKF